LYHHRGGAIAKLRKNVASDALCALYKYDKLKGMKASEEDLLKQLQDAKEVIEIGATYRHYKSPDMTYVVKDIVIQEADNQPCVIYQAQYGLGLTFARPVSVWLEMVEFGGETVPRFRQTLSA
jgi:hypothetical protein